MIFRQLNKYIGKFITSMNNPNIFNYESEKNTIPPFKLIISKNSLSQCIDEYKDFHKDSIEIGGLMTGTFDGITMIIRRFILDKKAVSNPTSIRLSSDVFKVAETEVMNNNKDKRSGQVWFIVGTWHTHPDGVNTYSSLDSNSLFIDRMRIITDDNSLVESPWVHIIFPGYKIDQIEARIFTMYLRSHYELNKLDDDQEINKKLKENYSTNLGLIFKNEDSEKLFIGKYHPDIFKMHKEGKITVVGLWKYFRYEKIIPSFEKVFMENFYQKIGLEKFIYVRILGLKTKIEWFNCTYHRDTNNVIDFQKINFYVDNIVEFQDIYAKKYITIDIPGESSVCDTAKILQEKLCLKSLPILYAILKNDAVEYLKERTNIEGDNTVILPDDITISYIIENMFDKDLPIYFRSEIPEDELFKLRTLRFHQAGYDIDILKNSKIVVAGAGLLGSDIAINLATIGVCNITLIDSGNVDWFNIYRQQLYSKKDTYKKKVNAAKENLEDIIGVKVIPVDIEIPSWTTKKDLEQTKNDIILLDKIIKDADIVIGVLDKFSPRALLQFLCLVRKKPFIVAAVEGNSGYVRIFDENAQDGCYCCGWPDPRIEKWPDGGSCTLSSIENSRIITSLTTKFIVDKLQDKIIQKNYISYNQKTMKIDMIDRTKSDKCFLCGNSGAYRSIKEDMSNVIINYLFR